MSPACFFRIVLWVGAAELMLLKATHMEVSSHGLHMEHGTYWQVFQVCCPGHNQSLCISRYSCGTFQK